MGFHPPEGLPGLSPAQARDRLGLEVDCLILELDSTFSPDALAIALGWVRGGGVLCILVDILGTDPYAKRLRAFLSQPPFRGIQNLPILPLPMPESLGSRRLLELNPGQQRFVAQVQGLPDAPRGQCIVVRAPRGRGKSTALGVLLAQWCRNPAFKVAVTARSRSGAEALLRSAGWFLGEDAAVAARYKAPEHLLAEPGRPDVLIVDEAAALPPSQLVQLMEKAERSVVATTTTGFEGSGRHFDLLLLRTLERNGLQICQYTLSDPVRWVSGDPLEDWLNRLLLLDSGDVFAAHDCNEYLSASGAITWYSGAALAAVELRLQAVVGLLRDAHYRTRPSDLRRWLDDPVLHFGLLTGPKGLSGVVVVAEEVGLDILEARAVFAGERRLQGRFIPNVLATQLAHEPIATSCWRVVRIAVRADLRRRGIGRGLLAAAAARATAAGARFIGASFGARMELLRFWSACGYQPLHVGFHRESVSGLHAVVVLQGLCPVAAAELLRRRERFKADWGSWRTGPLRLLEEDVVKAITDGMPSAERVVAIEDQESLRAFAHGRRLYEWCIPALHRWFFDEVLPNGQGMTDEELWIQDVLLATRSWSALAKAAGTSGRSGVLSHLRKRVAARLLPRP